MSSSLFLAALFVPTSRAAEVTHLGPIILPLLCGVGLILPIFVSIAYFKGLWALRRELQPARHAFGLIARIAVCAVASFASMVIYQIWVAPSVGQF